MRKVIKDWTDLARIPSESKTHKLVIDLDQGNGWLKAKNPKAYHPKKSFMRQVAHLDVYLSTHTFYGSTYNHSSKTLRACGFDVELCNWDAPKVN